MQKVNMPKHKNRPNKGREVILECKAVVEKRIGSEKILDSQRILAQDIDDVRELGDGRGPKKSIAEEWFLAKKCYLYWPFSFGSNELPGRIGRKCLHKKCLIGFDDDAAIEGIARAYHNAMQGLVIAWQVVY